MDANSLTQTFTSDRLRFLAVMIMTFATMLTSLLTIIMPFLLRRQKTLIERSRRELKLIKTLDDVQDELEKATAITSHVDDLTKRDQIAQAAMATCLQILRTQK